MFDTKKAEHHIILCVVIQEVIGKSIASHDILIINYTLAETNLTVDTHRNIWIKLSTPNQGLILEIEGINILSKLMISITLPCNIPPVDVYFKSLTHKSIGVIE